MNDDTKESAGPNGQDDSQGSGQILETDKSDTAAHGQSDISDRNGINPVVVIVSVVAVVLFALIILFAFSDNGGEPDTADQVLGDASPALIEETITGEEFDLADESGRWVVVNFFATWCPPCVAEHPELIAFAERNAQDATVVSVAFDEPAQLIEEFFAEHGGDWPVLVGTGDAVVEWAVLGLPESFLVTPDGIVVEKIAGGVTANELEDLIDKHSSDDSSENSQEGEG